MLLKALYSLICPFIWAGLYIFQQFPAINDQWTAPAAHLSRLSSHVPVLRRLFTTPSPRHSSNRFSKATLRPRPAGVRGAGVAVRTVVCPRTVALRPRTIYSSRSLLELKDSFLFVAVLPSFRVSQAAAKRPRQRPFFRCFCLEFLGGFFGICRAGRVKRNQPR